MYLMVISWILFTGTNSLTLIERSTSPTVLLLEEVLPRILNDTINKEANTTASTNLRIYPTATMKATRESPKHRQVRLTLMGKNLNVIPEGYSEIESVNFAYNNIKSLPCFVFWNNSYSGVKKINLEQNRIIDIHVSAFRGIRNVRHIDLSNNQISTIDPYTFKGNNRLEKLILMNNHISFDRLQTFLLSYSLDYLVMSNNKIDQIYELTFLGLPNLKTLILNDNSIIELAPNSFKALNKLRYLSLANTGVYRLDESMFLRFPRTINLEGTPLAAKFEPPLKKITKESVRNLLSLSRLMIEEAPNN